MNNKHTTYFFYIYPSVYVTIKNEKALLYDTQTGEYLKIGNQAEIAFLQELQRESNLGVIAIDENECNNPDVHHVLQLITTKKLGKLIAQSECQEKPFILPPVLNLQNDIEKMNPNDCKHLLGDNVLLQLSEVNLYIDGKCKSKNTCICPSIVASLLEQLKYSSVSHLSLFDENIGSYPLDKELVSLFNQYDYTYRFFVQLSNYDNKVLQEIENGKLQLLIDSFVDKLCIHRILSEVRQTVERVIFQITNEEEYTEALAIADRYQIKNYNIVPIFNHKNFSFFEDNVFLTEEDILMNKHSFRNIFCNSKLNHNYFGKLYIMSDGSVKAGFHCEVLGNIQENSIAEIVYKELIVNTAWRRIRNSAKCQECIYQFLCPPPSDYEFELNCDQLCKLDK